MQELSIRYMKAFGTSPDHFHTYGTHGNMSIFFRRRKSRRRMARIVVDGPITGSTRQRVLKALRDVEEREFPALLLRIDSPGGTVGDSQEIHAALLRLRAKGCRVVASFGNISASGGVYIGVAAESIVANPGTITGMKLTYAKPNTIWHLPSNVATGPTRQLGACSWPDLFQ